MDRYGLDLNYGNTAQSGTGLAFDLCAYCRGSCSVSYAKAEAYEVDDIDEVPCPRGGGRGTTRLVSDFCALCNGSCVVTAKKVIADQNKYGRE